MLSHVQAVLKGNPTITLPPFLLVRFSSPVASEVKPTCNSVRIACSVSAAATLRSLIDAGHLKAACSMIEEYVEECVTCTCLAPALLSIICAVVWHGAYC